MRKAHANMLEKMNVLTSSENKSLQNALDEILQLHKKGEFKITLEQEDGHTALEEFLTKKCGEAGKKIHTGRSRNDQALVMMRLFMKEKSAGLEKKMMILLKIFEKKSEKYGHIGMPGYTHMQKAMPTTVGQWFAGFHAALSDTFPFSTSLQNLLDQNPLGSASGFGIKNFPLQRKETTQEMGFKKIQENPLYCGLSRGLFESVFLNTFSHSILITSRFVNDFLFFTSDGKYFFELPDFLTTGSSIMPQKKNFDPGEIFRGKVSQFLTAKNEIESLQSGLLSGYNRDISLVKGTFIKAVFLLEELLEMTCIFAENISPNEENLQKSMTDDLFVTEKIYELVKKGIPFREAYKIVKEEFLQK